MSKLLDQLISEFENREQRGLRKYGTSMDRTDLSFDEWLQHFKEELLDGLVYLLPEQPSKRSKYVQHCTGIRKD